MWLLANTPIKVMDTAGVACIKGETDPAFEIDAATGAELLALGAAAQVDAPAANPAPSEAGRKPGAP